MVSKGKLIGNQGNNPEIKTLEGSNKVANFSLATSERWTDKQGQKQETTEWHNISVFGNLVDVVEKFVKKGDRLYIEGKLKTRLWEKDGITKYSTDIICTNFTMLGGNQNQ